MKNPQVVLKKLEEVRVQTLQRLDNLTQEQLDTRPPQLVKLRCSLRIQCGQLQ